MTRNPSNDALWILLLLVFLCGCDSRWAGLASQSALVHRLRANSSSEAKCEGNATQLAEYGFRLMCDGQPVFVRCGYERNTSCCWIVEDEEAASQLFGQNHSEDGLVCIR